MSASKTSFLRGVSLCVAGAIVILGFAACNTVAGVGKDVKSTGKAVERTAEDAKH